MPTFRFPIAALLLVVVAQPAGAQVSQPKADVFAGYSLLPANGDDFPRGTSHGVQVTAAVHLNRWFGVIADMSAQFSTNRDLGPNFSGQVARTRVVELLAGPRFTARSERADVFVHGLFGTSRGDAGPGFDGFSDSAVTFGGGGGVDVRLTRRLAVRASFDLIGSFADIVEGNTRFGAGLVVNLGAR